MSARGGPGARGLARGRAFALALALGLALPLCACAALDMPGRSARGKPGPLNAAQLELRTRLEQHVWNLAGRIGPRHRALRGSREEARAYIAWVWQRQGWQVRRQDYANDLGGGQNLWVERAGRSSREWLVLSAHYDTVRASPGADDDASGVAALLEIARACARLQPERGLVFAAFDDEEAGELQMGSRFFAAQLARERRALAGMLSLEMLGVYRDAPGSQRYPLAALGWLYPTRGDYLSFVGDWDSRELVRRCVGAFRAASPLPSEGIGAPRALRDIGRSDHAWFWRHGVPALMVTDTSNFRYAHYHKPSDTESQLDFSRLCLAVDGLVSVVQQLSGA